MFAFKFDTSRLEKAITEIGRELDNVSPVLQDVGTYLMSEVQLNFEKLSRRGTGVDGTKWKELDPKTEQQKAKRGRKTGKKGKKTGGAPQSQIGVNTGALRNSAHAGQAGNILEVDASQAIVTVGFGVAHAKFFAADRPLIPNEMPKDWNDGAQSIVDDWLGDILRRNLEG